MPLQPQLLVLWYLVPWCNNSSAPPDHVFAVPDFQNNINTRKFTTKLIASVNYPFCKVFFTRLDHELQAHSARPLYVTEGAGWGAHTSEQLHIVDGFKIHMVLTCADVCDSIQRERHTVLTDYTSLLTPLRINTNINQEQGPPEL